MTYYLKFYVAIGVVWLVLRVIGDFLQWADSAITSTMKLRLYSYATAASYLLAGVLYLLAMTILCWPVSVVRHYRKWRTAK